jgi:hypothetical protein
VVEFRGIGPSDSELERALQAYVGEAGSLVATETDLDTWGGLNARWSVVLVGRPSDPHPLLNEALLGGGTSQRLFEMERAETFSGLFIRTCVLSDTFTHVVAAGWAATTARLWDGAVETPT